MHQNAHSHVTDLLPASVLDSDAFLEHEFFASEERTTIDRIPSFIRVVTGVPTDPFEDASEAETVSILPPVHLDALPAPAGGVHLCPGSGTDTWVQDFMDDSDIEGALMSLDLDDPWSGTTGHHPLFADDFHEDLETQVRRRVDLPDSVG